jgi:hypothetical protein
MIAEKVIRVNDDDQKLKTYIQIIVDRSGSMDCIRKETIAHFNEQVQEIKGRDSDKMETFVSLTVFNTDIDFVINEEPADSLKELTEADYYPNGGTALFDAIGLSLDKLEQLEDIEKEHVSALVIVLTDGWENSSKIYKQPQVAARIKKLRDTKRWTFVYIGANQDLEKVSQDLNIPQTNMLNYCSDSVGTTSMTRRHRASVGEYMTSRSLGVAAVSDFYASPEESNSDSDSKSE